jgi:hypothetical protein
MIDMGGAKPTSLFARPEWQVSARAAAHFNEAERLKLVDCRRRAAHEQGAHLPPFPTH